MLVALIKQKERERGYVGVCVCLPKFVCVCLCLSKYVYSLYIDYRAVSNTLTLSYLHYTLTPEFTSLPERESWVASWVPAQYGWMDGRMVHQWLCSQPELTPLPPKLTHLALPRGVFVDAQGKWVSKG